MVMVMMRMCALLMDGHNSTPTNEKQSNDTESGSNCRMIFMGFGPAVGEL